MSKPIDKEYAFRLLKSALQHQRRHPTSTNTDAVAEAIGQYVTVAIQDTIREALVQARQTRPTKEARVAQQ